MRFSGQCTHLPIVFELAGQAEGGNVETDPSLTLLDILSDEGGLGGQSQSGGALGGAAGNILSS